MTSTIWTIRTGVPQGRVPPFIQMGGCTAGPLVQSEQPRADHGPNGEDDRELQEKPPSPSTTLCLLWRPSGFWDPLCLRT